MQYNLSAPSAWQFVAGNGSDAVNSWGQPRAYAIVPTGSPLQQDPADILFPQSLPMLKAPVKAHRGAFRMGDLCHQRAALHKMQIYTAI